MRRTVAITRILLLSFIRKRVWTGLLLAAMLAAVVFFRLTYGNAPELAIHMTAYGQMLLTLTFMMMGIQLQREYESTHLDEIIPVYMQSRIFYLRCQLLAIGVASIVVSAVLFLCFYVTALMQAPFLWVTQIFAQTVLVFCLPCFILGAWGLLIAQWCKGRGIYLPAILFWLITSSLLTDVDVYFSALNLGSFRFLHSMLTLGVVGLRYTKGISMIQPIDLPYWVVRMVIAAALVALLWSGQIRRSALTRRHRRQGSAAVSVVALCGLAALMLCAMQYNGFFARFASAELRETYTVGKAQEYRAGELVSLSAFPADKNITLRHTDIALACTAQGISARVDITAVTDAPISEQVFTLYSDLVVDGVLVDGESADFKRAHDGVLVYFPQPKQTGDFVTFTFRYHGYSLPIFPANETTVQLNRAFPWFPWPGLKTKSVYGNYYEYDESETFFIADWQRGDTVTYTLHYSGPGGLYTNLQLEGHGLYSGSSADGVTLYSGMVHSRHRDLDVYVPAGFYPYAEAAANAALDAYPLLNDICGRLGAAKMPQPPESIVVIEMSPPVMLPYPYMIPSELYAWGSQWELRNNNGSRLLGLAYHTDTLAFQNHLDVRVKTAVAFILSPSAGYPVNAPHASTSLFGGILAYYLAAPLLPEDTIAAYIDATREMFSIIDSDSISGVASPMQPLTEQEEEMLMQLLQRMRAGDDFDVPFHTLYQRLLMGERLSPSDIIETLDQGQGVDV